MVSPSGSAASPEFLRSGDGSRPQQPSEPLSAWTGGRFDPLIDVDGLDVLGILLGLSCQVLDEEEAFSALSSVKT